MFFRLSEKTSINLDSISQIEYNDIDKNITQVIIIMVNGTKYDDVLMNESELNYFRTSIINEKDYYYSNNKEL